MPQLTALQILKNRLADQTSTLNNRNDNAKLALVIEAGGMRGCISAAMGSALQLLGAKRCFDMVVGTSAGAMASTYFVANQLSLGASIYPDCLCDGQFINYARVAKIMNMEFLVYDVFEHQKPLNWELAISAKTPLHIVSSNITDGSKVVFSRFKAKDDLQKSLISSAKVPFLAGKAMDWNGVKYADGGLFDYTPYQTAFELGATHAIVLRNAAKPKNSISERFELWLAKLLIPFCSKGLSIALSNLATNMKIEQEILLEATNSGAALVIVPLEYVATTEQNPKILWQAMVNNYHQVFDILGAKRLPLPPEWANAKKYL